MHGSSSSNILEDTRQKEAPQMTQFRISAKSRTFFFNADTPNKAMSMADNECRPKERIELTGDGDGWIRIGGKWFHLEEV